MAFAVNKIIERRKAFGVHKNEFYLVLWSSSSNYCLVFNKQFRRSLNSMGRMFRPSKSIDVNLINVNLYLQILASGFFYFWLINFIFNYIHVKISCNEKTYIEVHE